MTQASNLAHVGHGLGLRLLAGAASGNRFSMDEAELKARLNVLTQEHRDMDAAIDALTRSTTADMLQIARLKKRKLRLKDEIQVIQDMLIPDIIA